ncbi:MAG: RusA family crossover junction endodeoxyribonuclease [Planctomycetes bacterium]|nr:RusA family crossover junction endodeoxyribonuclease [Planctomycetota bacterium]
MRIIYLHRELPPSSNKIYYNKGKGRGLLAKADAYKTRFSNGLNQQLVRQAVGSLDPNGLYELRLLFLMHGVGNSGWPKKAKKRFRKMDVDNRVKLVWDATSEATGVDDRNNFILQAFKGPVETPQEEGVLLLVQEIQDVSLEYLLGLFLVDEDGSIDEDVYHDILEQIRRV